MEIVVAYVNGLHAYSSGSPRDKTPRGGVNVIKSHMHCYKLHIGVTSSNTLPCSDVGLGSFVFVVGGHMPVRHDGCAHSLESWPREHFG